MGVVVCVTVGVVVGVLVCVKVGVVVGVLDGDIVMEGVTSGVRVGVGVLV